MKIIKFEDMGIDKTGKFYVSKFTMNNGRIIKIKFPTSLKSKGMINAQILRSICDKASILGHGITEKEWNRFNNLTNK